MIDDIPDREALTDGEQRTPMFKPGRPRGMLTQTDREVLLKWKRYDSEQGLRNARHRIREHIRNSLHDIILVANFIEQDELRQVVNRIRELDEKDDREKVLLSQSVVKFACRIAYLDGIEKTEFDFAETLESDLISAIRHTIDRADDGSVVTDVNVDITIETEDDSEELINKLISGDASWHAVVSAVDKEQLRETLRERNETFDLWGMTVGPDHEFFEQ